MFTSVDVRASSYRDVPPLAANNAGL